MPLKPAPPDQVPSPKIRHSSTGIATIVYDDAATGLADFMKALEEYGYDYDVEVIEPQG